MVDLDESQVSRNSRGSSGSGRRGRKIVGYDIQGQEEDEDTSYNFNTKPAAGKRGSRGVATPAGEDGGAQKKYLPTASRGGKKYISDEEKQ